MKLAGQGAPTRTAERGYAMAALLVGMSVMAVLMSAALPSWTHASQREREEEYLFRAKQYARAIRLWQDKNKIANAPAPSVDMLIEGRFLRKKYKDPLTNDDFRLIQSLPAGLPGGATGPTPPTGLGAPNAPSPPSPTQPPPGQQGSRGGAGPPLGVPSTTQPPTLSGQQTGGFIGVTSKSKQQGIKLFKGGQTTYDQWAITYMDVPSLSAAVGGANPDKAPGGNTNLFGPGNRGGTNPGNQPMPPGGGFGPAAPGPAAPREANPFGSPAAPTPRLPPPPSGPGTQPFTPLNPASPRPPRPPL